MGNKQTRLEMKCTDLEICTEEERLDVEEGLELEL